MALFHIRTLAHVAQDALELTILPQFSSVEIIGMILLVTLLSPVIFPYFKICWAKSTQWIFCLPLDRHLEVGTNHMSLHCRKEPMRDKVTIVPMSDLVKQ